MTRGGILNSYRIVLVTEIDDITRISVFDAVIVPLIGSSRHRQCLGYLFYSLCSGHLTALDIGHCNGIGSVCKTFNSISASRLWVLATVSANTISIPSYSISWSTFGQIHHNETIITFVALAVEICHLYSGFRIHLHCNRITCRCTVITIRIGHCYALRSYRAPLSHNNIAFTRRSSVSIKWPHIISHATLCRKIEGSVGLGSVDTNFTTCQSRHCQSVYRDGLRSMCHTICSTMCSYKRDCFFSCGSPYSGNGVTCGRSACNRASFAQCPCIGIIGSIASLINNVERIIL